MTERSATDPSSDVDAALENVLTSRTFARSSRQRALIRYIVREMQAGRAAQIKESSIALDVFERAPSSYDPATDPIVRVSVTRLRELLDRYYADEGRDASLRIELPRGGYAPIFRRTTLGTLPSMPRIAVLPLANFSGRAELESLCDGLSEDLIDALAGLNRLRVVARTSSFAYKGKAIDVRRIARELSVDAVLEGSIQRVGEQLRVVAQLILASDGTHLWSHAFEADVADRAGLRHALIDITEATLTAADQANQSARLRLRATARDDSKPAGTVDPPPDAANDAYYRALFLYRKDTLDGYIGAEQALSEAVAIAPNFARAYALLGKILWAIGNSGARPLRAAAADGAAASRRAIELQPNDPLALEVHTRYLLLHDYQPIAAFKSAKAAAKLAPNDVATLLLLGYIATYLSENLIARESLERARTLDPLSLDPLNGLVNHLIFVREYTAALALCEEILRREPGAVITGWNRAHCYRMLGRIDAARAAFADTVNRSPSSGNYLALMEAIFTANEGRIDDARAQRAHALAELPWADDPMTYAILDALIGDDEGVYCAWESAITAHDPYVYSSYYHVEFDRFRHEERFQRITHALGLPPTATPKIKIRPR